LVGGANPTARLCGQSERLPDGANPVEWLVCRQRGLRAIFWAAAAISTSYHLLFWLVPQTLMRGGAFSVLGYWLIQLPGLAASCLAYGLFAWGASRFVMQARMTGELELLLTTRLDPERLISGQSDGLRSLLTPPITLMVLVVWLIHIYPAGLSGPPNVDLLEHVVPALASSLRTLALVVCLCWLALDLGLRSPTQFDVIRRSLLAVILVPLVISGAAAMLFSPLLRGVFQGWFQARGINSYPFIFLGQQLVLVAFFLWMIRRARRRLTTTLAGADAASFSLRPFP